MSARSPPNLTRFTMAATRRSIDRSTCTVERTNRSSVVVRAWTIFNMRALQHDLVEGILDDPLSSRGLQPGDQITHRPFFDNRVHGHPFVVAECRDRRTL